MRLGRRREMRPLLGTARGERDAVRPPSRPRVGDRRRRAFGGPPIRDATWKRRGSAGPRRRVATGRDGSRRNAPVAGHFTQPATGGSSPRVDGKEGVAGSSPAEGSKEPAGNGGFRRSAAASLLGRMDRYAPEAEANDHEPEIEQLVKQTVHQDRSPGPARGNSRTPPRDDPRPATTPPHTQFRPPGRRAPRTWSPWSCPLARESREAGDVGGGHRGRRSPHPRKPSRRSDAEHLAEFGPPWVRRLLRSLGRRPRPQHGEVERSASWHSSAPARGCSCSGATTIAAGGGPRARCSPAGASSTRSSTRVTGRMYAAANHTVYGPDRPALDGRRRDVEAVAEDRPARGVRA